jgi:hypothetical protein
VRPALIIVLDTGPLLTYLAVHYIETIKAKISTRDRILQSVRPAGRPFDDSLQNAFTSLCRETRRLLTTSNALTEALKARKNSALYRREDFHDIALSFLAESNIEELPRPARSLIQDTRYRDHTLRLGLTDMGLVSLAVEFKCPLLTDDGEMFQAFPASSETGFEISLLDEYLLRKS